MYPTVNDQPGFPARMRELRENRGFSQASLSFALYEADPERRGYDQSFINRIEKGKKAPPTKFMMLLGEVLQPAPEELPEYHLAMMRRALDEREIGLDQALANLQRLDEAVIAEDQLGHWLTERGRVLTGALEGEQPSRPSSTDTEAPADHQAKGQA